MRRKTWQAEKQADIFSRYLKSKVSLKTDLGEFPLICGSIKRETLPQKLPAASLDIFNIETKGREIP